MWPMVPKGRQSCTRSEQPDRWTLLGVWVCEQILELRLGSLQTNEHKWRIWIEQNCPRNSLIYNCRHLYPRKYLILFYHSFAKSIINCGLLIYGSAAKTSLGKIERVQRRTMSNLLRNKIGSYHWHSTRKRNSSLFSNCILVNFRRNFTAVTPRSASAIKIISSWNRNQTQTHWTKHTVLFNVC